MAITLNGTTGVQTPNTFADAPTGAAFIPVGTTAERPSSPAEGMIRYNTTTGEPEWYDPATAQWLAFSQPSSYSIEYLVIGGGGGGSLSNAFTGGGAGGAGGYRCSVPGEDSGGGNGAEALITVTKGAAFTVTVGAGGADRTSGSSSAFGPTIVSLGGGRGAGFGQNGAATGGSGGGGAYNGQPGAAGTSGQGFAGGDSDIGSGGGGGGAGGTGGSGSSNRIGGNGGAGVTSSITGTAVARAGGGGGGATGFYATPAVGGTATAGGGNGASGANAGGTAGTANTGGGGGGPDGDGSSLGGAGGSGVVIVRYIGAQKGTGGTVISAGGYTIHTFTSSGTFTA
jgi:hypothetical protein